MNDDADTCETNDEANEGALVDADPDNIVLIHDADCEIDEDDVGCTCEPIILVGAKA